MSHDNYLGMIASKAMDKEINKPLSFRNQGWSVETIKEDNYFIYLKIIKSSIITYMLCYNYNNINFKINNKVKKINGKEGEILNCIWLEYNKNINIYKDFVNTYKIQGQLVVTGYKLGGSVAGIASAMFNIKSILINPIPFIIHRNWLKNYNILPKSYVIKEEKLNILNVNNYNVTLISPILLANCHNIKCYIDYFRKKTNKLC
tara:strand:+ start:1244 stop:1855 length:612 start_codon:yes stop_codon:yes gene_type:complete